ncbi:MAG: hypothetical protein A2509_00060 [Candidatus Edwardsbacteria bacterium RIFOXYD12_FULL_50_11]|uniref:Uncharacterized protein n=1 Tax=Candidatus Edwardsbacteria bacterium GWF2_54_11 TaxID=1817851 RepID=A0A1F5RD48_9BACT|nr:MAG: hypothetical protein A2502_08020 [Candidatus Edwardsbacteria bacterium RifOxyC12_full_54_24]OGF07460.1 MAG: hypothetical protein A2273_03040 [Candidatus Edwardsbacteria bacterium RifOxyA12_full_54_48]OGF09710.1 MAG: hypothetical protein A3K15_09450 [Candidatus Edwardsbacteria bacterium GWE2_54_12]OGF11973.1 MAG: hypothetical protein A2024_03005 [Candidatus Edwardsbacteria bacterium GWF2_54_11]OGF16658.1 MAG: hypothetical protein A2509_00060 [Candidatus Edwardsbacteria bacterium RIFOXYD1
MKQNLKISLPVLIFGMVSLTLTSGCNPEPPKTRRLPHDYSRYKLSKYDSLEYFNISPDGNRFMALYKIKDQWFAQVNERVFEDFQGTLLDSFSSKPKYSLSPEGSRVGLVYQKENPYLFRVASGDPGRANIPPADTLPRWFVQINQNVYGGFDGDHMPVVKYSPDGSVFGFVYKNRGWYYIRLNDEIFGPYQKADLGITSDGRITIARIDKGYAYLEEIEKTPNPKQR